MWIEYTGTIKAKFRTKLELQDNATYEEINEASEDLDTEDFEIIDIEYDCDDARRID